MAVSVFYWHFPTDQAVIPHLPLSVDIYATHSPILSFRHYLCSTQMLKSVMLSLDFCGCSAWSPAASSKQANKQATREKRRASLHYLYWIHYNSAK
ncbi:hypothetical protein I7I53_04358 [Histoplasma capsulatum var. duboisii H88]|uniref:Uncharacterized protein n=1 Tax=Ajellomyces capsulatus (strain H88) TaxID=544711 RepID=A0A8A1LPJ3_AJEC8|nr:hypothetical protein I7I53_04358 [Histoplasma capsulatum var. duboisii H88]